MRHSQSVVLIGLILSSAALAQTETEVPTTNSSAPTMTAIQPVNPVSSKPGGPIIQSITAQIPTRGALQANLIIPQFHFIAPNGNAVLIHRELVETSANRVNIPPSAVINIPADAQKQGAIVGGAWNCNVNPYYVTIRAYIMDADGNLSNEVQYTIHCNGG
jgi:hypothetical protein